MAINKFYTLNKMQSQELSKFHNTAWELRATFNGKSRCVSFIRKTEHGYDVTLTQTTHKTFMAALASLIPAYVNQVYLLIRSTVPLDYTSKDVSDILEMKLTNAANWDLDFKFKPKNVDLSVPRLPTYDRGPKKEVLHPLRKAVTRFFGGKYSR